MHKLRFAQDLALYNLALSEALPDFDGSIHRQIWMEDPAWQPTRENVERITGIRDWAEAVFVANCIYEPLVGELFRSQFVMQVAASHGDYTTPSVVGAGESDYFRDLRYTVDLFGMLVNDKDHGAENIETLQAYVDQWTPLSISAARHLQPLWSQPGNRVVRFEDAFDTVKDRFNRLMAGFGLDSPKELKA
jgi:propane monooxygenase small subunit